MRFPNFAGNQEIKYLLENMFTQGRLPHAIILQGEDGLGKHTLAEILAAAAVCSAGEEAPCGKCPGCIKAAAGSHPDIHRAQGTGASRSFHVEEIRFIRSDVYKKPHEARHRVYLLFGAHTMSVQAQNALLKVLEEPPEYALFILTCPSASALLPTVCSRAQIFTLTPPPFEEAVETALKKCPRVTPREMEEAARRWGCNIGKMLSSFEEEDRVAASALAVSIAKAACAPQELPLLEMTAPLLRDRDLIRQVMDSLLLVFRDACAVRAGSSILLAGDSDAGDAARMLAGSLTRERLARLPELVRETRERVDRNANTPLLVTEFCARLRALAGK